MVHTGWAAIEDFSTVDERGLGTCGAGVSIAFCRLTKNSAIENTVSGLFFGPRSVAVGVFDCRQPWCVVAC